MSGILYKAVLGLPLIFSLAIAVPSGSRADLVAEISSDREFKFDLHLDYADLDRRVEPDSSVIMFKTIQVGIPYGARVTLLSAGGDSLAPLPAEAELLLSTSSLASHPLVELSNPIEVRGRDIVAVRVFPVVGTSIYSRVTVHLGFTGGHKHSLAPADDPQFDRIFRAAVANFDQFRHWPVARSAARLSAVSAGPFSTVPVWYKIAVNKTGFCRVTGAQLEQAGMALNNLPSDSLHLFNGGGLPLEIDNTEPRPAFREVAILVQDGGDGIFHRDDSIVFFAEVVDRWLYPADRAPYFVNHPYTDRNIYWLAASGLGSAGLRMATLDVTPLGGSDTVITSFKRYIHTEQDNLLRRFSNGKIEDYYTWYWTNDTTLTFFIRADGAIDGDTADIYLSGLTLDNGNINDEIGYMDLYINGFPGLNKVCNRTYCNYQTTDLEDGLNEIGLRLWPEVSASPYFNYMNLSYPSTLTPVNNALDLTLGIVAADAGIEVLDDFTATPLVLDISDPTAPVRLTGFEQQGGLITLEMTLLPDRFSRLYLAPLSEASSPLSVQQAHPSDLRAGDSQVDLFIIAPQVFSTAVADYVDYRHGTGKSMMVAAVEDIMDNFAFGLYDPLAIRDFLKYAYENYPTPVPSAVLLVGDGTYDFLDHLGTGVPNYVPPCILPSGLDESVSDDNYVYFGEYGILDSDTSYDTSFVMRDRGYDMVMSRWPVRTTGEIMTVIDKIRRYEVLENRGIWRTDFTLVADDEFGSFNDETFHVTQTEELEKNHIPRLYRRNKIYLWEYPFVSGAKPDVNNAIVDAVNNGTLLVNFVGHGNPDVWAHELVFTRTADVPRLSNYNKLPLFFSASCAIGFFDDPKREAMTEDLLVHPGGGAIGVVSATRMVYASDNALFNQKVFDVMLYNESLSVAEAVYTAKLLRQYGSSPFPGPEENDRAYLWFGDPCLKPGVPELEIEFSDPPTTLKALERTRIVGRVRDRSGGIYRGDGVLLINVYDSERPKTYRLLNDSGVIIQKIDYSVTGPTIYRGSATITATADTFYFDFVTPLDVGYGGQGARIVVYALFDSTDAAGLIDSLPVSDTLV
ncbi:MAG: C25 family cysteine peptidase, partial [Candidatus Zixiibacteriota bacterium]